jgi:hypothetical protein
MSEDHSVSFTSRSPETVMPPLDPDVAAALNDAAGLPDPERRAALARIAARWPRCLDAWASLAEQAADPVERYAYARVGYHRGLDALRAAGWRGSGEVRWSEPSNRGFLRSLAALAGAAGAIGETDEEERCRLFLLQLDPSGGPAGPS